MPDTVSDLVAQGWQVCALTPAADAVPLHHVQPGERVALLLGAERVGLTPESMAAATVRVSIPMHAGVDSLNVANAAAVACWHLSPRT
jgi:tRNA G18 (ribose-2'-O)-methylase SpoU